MKPYFHELNDKEYKKIFKVKGRSWQWLMDNYSQPDWCTYPEALCGDMGCWSLVWHRKEINEEYCKNCDLHKDKK
jgi:hypothetical protein